MVSKTVRTGMVRHLRILLYTLSQLPVPLAYSGPQVCSNTFVLPEIIVTQKSWEKTNQTNMPNCVKKVKKFVCRNQRKTDGCTFLEAGSKALRAITAAKQSLQGRRFLFFSLVFPSLFLVFPLFPWLLVGTDPRFFDQGVTPQKLGSMTQKTAERGRSLGLGCLGTLSILSEQSHGENYTQSCQSCVQMNKKPRVKSPRKIQRKKGGGFLFGRT